MRIRKQFRLKTLLVACAIAAAAIYAVRSPYVAERRKLNYVEKYNAAIDARLYEVAQQIADGGLREFSGDPLMMHVARQITALRSGPRVVRPADDDADMRHLTPFDPESDIDFPSRKKWRDLTKRETSPLRD